VVQITLNGYELADPYGKKAKSAQISIFMSLVPNMVLEKVRQITIAAFHPKGTNAHTLALASFSTIRDTFQTAPDFLYLDIGGELSDVAVTKDGLLLESASFPAGRNTIVSAAAKAFATSPEQASSLIRLYEEGKLDDTTKEKVRPVLDEAGENWMKSLSDALTRLSDHVSLPKESYAVIDGDLLPFFMRTLSAGSFSPTLVSADRLKDSVSFSEHAEKDAFIAIASAFAARAYDMI
jgi:Actin-like ATPase involved in cell division